MPPHASGSPIDPAERAAALIQDAFEDYNARFSDITRRARRRFERREWRQSRADAVARIDLADAFFPEALGRLEGLLDERVRSRPLWRAIRQAYARRIAALPDRERALMTKHYWEGKNLLEAGAELGISKSWASRLHAQAVERLRSYVDDS